MHLKRGRLKKIMKYKIAFILVCAVLTACGERRSMFLRPQFDTPPSLTQTQAKAQPNQTTKAAVLLPLSGPQKALGEALRNAGMMAQFERAGNGMDLVFFDTKGTAAGAKEAYEAAMKIDPDIIIGPVFTHEVQEMSGFFKRVPVLSFTSDPSVLSEGIYSLALFIPNQVRRMTAFACASGQQRIAVIGPENKTGELVMNALSEAVQACPGMEITKISLYPPQTINFDPPLMKILPTPIDPKKKNLTEEEQELLNTPMADRLEFDALFIFEDGVKLTQISSLLSYYDVTPKVVPFYGLSTWQKSRERSLSGAYFPGLPPDRYRSFEQQYKAYFGSVPPTIAGYAYDAVSLASFLGVKRALNQETLTTPSGYYGVNGRFKLNADGTNERLLSIYQLTPRKTILIEAAPSDFDMPLFHKNDDVSDEHSYEPTGEDESAPVS